MRRFLSCGILAIAIAAACGGRVLDPGTGSGGSAGTAGTTVGGTTTGTGGSMVGGTTTGTGGSSATGGTGGSGGAGGAIDPGPELSSCTGPGQCELAMLKCCSCGILGLDQLAAINSAKREVYRKQVCGPNPTPCPECVVGIEPHLLARCESGRCRGFDIRTDPAYTKCGSDQECTLRKGLTCCQCQAPGDWVAVSRVGDTLVSAATCAPGLVCPACVPVPPSGTSAVCRSGTCEKTP